MKNYREYFKPKVGDYVKVKNDSMFFSFANNKIFKIRHEDGAEYYLMDIYDNYPPIMFSSITKKHVRHLTSNEKKELELLLNINKYNI